MLNAPLIRVRGVVKDYGGLRPLRIESLDLARGEIVVVEGFDEPAAAVLVDLLTGTSLPDRGAVAVGEWETASLADHEAWLRFLEQFGLVGGRVVLLDAFTVLQNVAVPITLDIDPLQESVRSRAIGLAAEVGLDQVLYDAPLAAASGLTRFRVRLARAIAHEPRALLLEHPTLGLAADEVLAAARALRAVAQRRDLAVLCVSGDVRFAEEVASRRLLWAPATGRLADRSEGRGWFRKR